MADCGFRYGRQSSMEGGRTDGGHLHPFLFSCFFLARGREGSVNTFSTHSTLAGPG